MTASAPAVLHYNFKLKVHCLRLQVDDLPLVVTTPHWQMAKATDAGGLLGFAYPMVTTTDTYLGATRARGSGQTGLYREWQWVDGTNSTNLNCGSASCGPWSPTNPSYVQDHASDEWS